MKIHKLLFLATFACLAISCSQDTFEEPSIDDPNDRLVSGQYDSSYIGLYKGLFTTNDGLIRGSVEVAISPTNEGTAQIKLSSGELIQLKSNKAKLTVDNRIANLHFSSEGLSSTGASLKFSVDGDGIDPMISDVLFDTKESNILIAKNLSRIPLTPLTGTFDCTNCAAVGIGFPNGRTWNIMSIGSGNNQNFMLQVSYGGRIYSSPAANNTQNGCVPVVNYTVCGIAGSIHILGYDVTWNGTHVYESSDDLSCSSINGNWSAPGYGPGVFGIFQSDSDCSNPIPVAPMNDLCENATNISLGDSLSGATTSATNGDTPDFCDEELSGSANGAGVWYSFSSLTDANIQVDTEGSDFDTQLRVFSGVCGSLVCVDNDDDDGTGLQSLIQFSASANMTYYIFVGGYNAADGDYVLNVSEFVAPPSFDLDLTCNEFLIDNGEGGNYANNSLDTYTIDAGAGNTLQLYFTLFDLEDFYDDLVIYDGPDTSSPIITTSVGGASNEWGQNGGFTWGDLQDDTILSSGQYLTLVFSSDMSTNYAGFIAEVTCMSGRSANKGLQKSKL